MTIMRRSSALLHLLFQCALQRVRGHLYMMTPVSRNLWGTTAFNDPSYEYINYCPHCYQSRGPAIIRDRAERLTDPAVLELYGNGAWPLLAAYERGEVAANGNFLESDAIAVRHGICGDPEQTSPEESNRYGRANTNYPVIDTYTEGSIVEIRIVVSTSHVGHFEFFLCDTADMDDPDGVVNQECFNMHPLDRAEDDGDASPIDPNFPGRYYLDPPCRSAETDQTLLPGVFPGDVATARYQLPFGITCSRCILQMVYYTGNSCMHVGYDEFNPPSWPSECAPNKRDWIVTGLGTCGEGDNYPEEYWNCADIEIIADGAPTSPAPVPAPVPEPSSEPETPAPIDEETPAPTNEETPAPINDETPAPTNEETPAPINDETPAPTNEETPAPINDETPAPTNEETPAPINGETPAPTNEETPAPINDETPAPTNEETPAPINNETPAPTNEETPAPINDETPAPTNEETALPTNTETSDPINFDTPAPTNEATPSPMTIMTPYPIAMLTPSPVNDETSDPTNGDTPAPVIEQNTAPETASPSLSDGEPFNEPILITLPPATFAPSIAATEMPPDECDDPVAAYGQCGGGSYEGSTCCRPGYECTAVADCYSECRPMAELSCSEGWGQCGGLNWEGPTCCWEGATCLERNEWFSQCVPENRIYNGAIRA